MKLRLPMLVWGLTLAACAPRHAPIPAAPPTPDFGEIEIEVAGLPGINEISLVQFEPAPFEETPAGLLASDAPVPEGIDFRSYDIPMEVNPRVQFWIDLFTGRERNRFATYLARQGLFEEMITTRLAERGLPSELLYLALIESGFSPVARSRANAIGLWQFIAGTARSEKLSITEFLDERRDPVRATDAAFNHLEGLYARFGSWYLAAAAYNSGAGRVERALRRTSDGERGHDSIYWSIHSALPRETREYVPKLIAATIIARNRELFGFADVVPMQPEPVDTVEVPDATDFDVIAEAAGVEAAQIAALNPQYYRGVTPPRRDSRVLVPGGRGEAFTVAYAGIPPEERVRYREHIVRKGETLSGIASRYGVTVAVLQETNGIRRASRIQIGQRIRIPSPATRRSTGTRPSATASGSAPAASTSSGSVVRYSVRRGDTIWSIARREGVTPQEIMDWNSLTRDSIIRPGDRLIIKQQ
ncbi:MAG: LysM peptidoglycan-binding domain-containing protein [Gemmatimonadetes bacterium]|nr:LysM peptidoglycan-binding domain-containing protein [Gemmatimonadota bacterium]